MSDKVWQEARKLDKYGLSDETTNDLAACIVREREAWARLVSAERAYIGGTGSPHDYLAARQALRDLGVDVDALLGGG